MNIKEIILDYINSLNEPTTPSKISKELNLSYPTVLKHIDVLFAEDKIIIQDMGNNKIISKKEDKKEDINE